MINPKGKWLARVSASSMSSPATSAPHSPIRDRRPQPGTEAAGPPANTDFIQSRSESDATPDASFRPASQYRLYSISIRVGCDTRCFFSARHIRPDRRLRAIGTGEKVEKGGGPVVLSNHKAAAAGELHGLGSPTAGVAKSTLGSGLVHNRGGRPCQ
jgi:hypothetical protein